MKKFLLLGFAFTGLLTGCESLNYGRIDCSVLEGKAARLCQEYRQRKADADIREEVARLVKNYRLCLDEKAVDPRSTKDCSVYQPALRALDQVTPLNLNK